MEKQKGLVLRSTGSWYKIKTESGSLNDARLKGKLKLLQNNTTNPVAVGDWVWLEPEDETQQTYSITEVEARRNYIIRKSVHKKGHSHVLAANLDLALVICTLDKPKTSLGFIDRFLVTTEAYSIPAGIIFNKADLLEPEDKEVVEAICGLYDDLGYKTIITSANTGENMEQLLAILQEQKTLLTGQSGVGKSSIINWINPYKGLKTKEISSYSNKGKHTTTFAEMFEIGPDTFIIDTPGIKELGLVDMEKDNIGHYFPEMRDLMNQCKYHNCTHLHEPECAVLAALQKQEIAESRYLSYLSILENDDNRR